MVTLRSMNTYVAGYRIAIGENPTRRGRHEHDPAESTLSVVRRSVEPPSQTPVIGSASGHGVPVARCQVVRAPQSEGSRSAIDWLKTHIRPAKSVAVYCRSP
jgi:hypothetical protein